MAAPGNSYQVALRSSGWEPDVLEFTDDSAQPGSGGGGSSATTEGLSASSTFTHGASSTNPSFTSSGPDSLCDLTDPTNPLLVTAGTYLLTYTTVVSSDVAFLLPVTQEGQFVAGASVPPDATAMAAETSQASASEVQVVTPGQGIQLDIINPNASDLSGNCYVTVTKLA